MTILFAPPVVPVDQALPALACQGYAVLDAAGAAALLGVSATTLKALGPAWHELPPDRFLKDGGRYRFRRHASYTVTGTLATEQPHRAHWQPLSYNALHGGMHRWFEPVVPEVAVSPAWTGLLCGLARWCSQAQGVAGADHQPWYVEAHQFRINTAGGIGRPTPEGAHRDGVDFVAVFLVARHQVKGGETRVFDAAGPAGQRFTLTEPWSLLLLDDARVIHESTPIQPMADDAGTGVPAYRDTLVITLRRAAFLDETPPA
jgi:hypothetical protein